jgi:TatA/E family protein of Tat protein translocase
MLRPEPLDIVIIALVALLLFGDNRLAESARSIAKAIREFRAAISGQKEDDSSKPKST